MRPSSRARCGRRLPALDAFVDGVERRVDLADVNGRTYVNNVSLGIYALAVSRPRYRTAKLRTLADATRAVLAPGRELPEIRFTDDTGRQHRTAAVVLVSNNAYAVDRVIGRGTRPRLDSGQLGIVVLDGAGGSDRAWSSATLRIDVGFRAHAGLDGEAIILEPPLRFTSRPGVLRARISSRHPGLSPSALLPRRLRFVVPRLAHIAAGRD